LGRIVRRLHAHLFAEHCVDHDTRLISKNDHVDTAVDGWQDRSIFSAWHHERSNRDTSDRIKRAHRGRFKSGGALRRLIPGIVKPPGAKTDDDLYKDPYWEKIYDEWFMRLENGQTFSDIADWLNSIGAPTGCKRGDKQAKTKYDCQLVGQRTRNVALKGVRVQNNRMSVRVNKTGRRKTVKAPPELRQERFCPRLVFIKPERYDRVLAIVSRRNEDQARGRKSGRDVRKGVSRKRTRFPGQCSFCWICGRLFVYGGHGQVDHLMCDGARKHKCWNGATIDAPLAATKIAEAVSREVESLEDFELVYLGMLDEEARKASELLDVELARLQDRRQVLENEAANLLQFLREGSQSELVRSELRRVEQDLAQLNLDIAEAERTRPRAIELPSAEELKRLYHQQFRDLAVDGYEFAGHLRRLVPRIVVFPYRLCDGGKVVLRARFKLQLASLIPDVGTRTVLQKPLEKVLSVDLFEPPQREKFRTQVVTLFAAGKEMQQKAIAKHLDITETAVYHAVGLQRLMDQLGITDPYLPVVEPPTEGKLQRHKHKRYRFDPLPVAGEL
jgi:hypothetical protein